MTLDPLDLLAKFCLPGDRKLARPFVIGQHTYATNRKVVVRLGFVVAGVPTKGPPADQLDWSVFSMEATFAPLPVLPILVVIPCSQCGSVVPDARCRNCNGTGRHRCEIPIQVGNQAYSDVVIEHLYQLPHAQLAPNPSHPFGPGLVRFDGGEALVMPMSR